MGNFWSRIVKGNSVEDISIWKIDELDQYGWAQLHWACSYGHKASVEHLLSNGANIEAKDLDGKTPLHKATSFGHLKIVKLLIFNGAKVNVKDNEGWTPLLMASLDGHESIAKFLIANGGDIRSKNNNGRTALHEASARGHTRIVKLLIDNGATVNEQDGVNNWTPLHLACQGGHVTTAKCLLENGADIGARSDEGSTVLHELRLIASGKLIDLLFRYGADTTLVDDNNQTALSLACQSGQFNVAKALLKRAKKEDKLHQPQFKPKEMLWRACYNNFNDIAQLLIRNYKDSDKDTI